MEERKKPVYDFYVLIPYYNNLPGLIRALESIAYDPLAYALLIVDDGSTEPLQHSSITPHVPQSLSVTILQLKENQGITSALNTGLRWLEKEGNSRYIARLDCGDVCLPERMTRQVAFMDAHPEVKLIGSWCIFKNFRTGESYRYVTPTEYKPILKEMHFRNVFIHPTVMWRSNLTKEIGVYPEDFPHAEDYGFFYEIISKGEAAVLPADLVICEINPQGISLSYRQEQLKSRIKVVRRYGNNGLYRLLGVLKLRLLLGIPYRLILEIKKVIYGIKHNRVN
ncbi:MAG: glycosyltransferase [Bacteroidetes bacterium]|nr:glycosyltransferase [Bacteroidota bacterium]